MGTRTVWVVQMLDYAGPGNAASERVTRQVAAELRNLIGELGLYGLKFGDTAFDIGQ